MDPFDFLDSLDSQNPFGTDTNDFPISQNHFGEFNDLDDLFAQGPNMFNYDQFSSTGFSVNDLSANNLITPGRDGQEANAGGRGFDLSDWLADEAASSWGRDTEHSSYASSGMSNLGVAFQGLVSKTSTV